MGAAFTTGPWQNKHDFSKEGRCTIVANVDGDTDPDGSTTYSFDFICTCEDEYGEYTERAEGNARLIVAAPKLYEKGSALVEQVATLLPVIEKALADEWDRGNYINGPQFGGALEEFREVLASVDGRRMAETQSGAVRSTTSAVPNEDSGDAQPPSGDS